MTLSTITQQRCRELLKYFLVPSNTEKSSKEISDLSQELPNGLRNIAENFINRINTTIQTTATPYLLSNRAATDKHFQRISIAARILSLKLDAVDGETDQALDIRRSEEAHQEAKVNMKNFCASEEGIDAICLESADFLLRLHNRSEIESVAREILLQGTLSTWAALEMLIGDSLVFLLNFEPRIATKLLSDPNAT
jgi:hypothetical protein